MKLGMVFEGGASRTAFSCGVMDAFLEEELMPDYFIGVSAGIAFGVSYLSKQKGRNLKLLEEYMADKRYMGLKYLFDRKKKSYYNIGFVFDEVPNKLLPFDYETFAGYKGVVEACVTNIHTGKAEYLPVPRDDRKFTTVVASCALPLLFQPVKVGHHYYVDGGVADSIPYKKAIEAGCDKNIVVLTQTRDYRKGTDRSTKLFSKMYCRYPKVAEAMLARAEKYNACLDELKELEKEGKVFIIAPEDTYGVGRAERNMDKLERLYDQGYNETRLLIPELKEYLES